MKNWLNIGKEWVNMDNVHYIVKEEGRIKLSFGEISHSFEIEDKKSLDKAFDAISKYLIDE